MAQKRKLDLKELELQLPPMDSNETKIILGGNDYGDDSLFHLINTDPDTLVHIVNNCVDGDGVFGGNNNGGNNNGGNGDYDDDDGQYNDGYADQGDLDHYFDGGYDNAGDGDDTGSTIPGTAGFNLSAALSSINNQVNEVYNGLSQSQIENSFTFDSDFTNYSVFGSQLSNILATNSCLAQLVGSITTNSGSHINFDIVQGLPAGTFGETSFNPTNGEITIQLNQSWLSQNIGWNIDNQNPNSYGINYAALSMNQDFVALLTHELVHAQNLSLVISALQHSPTHSPTETRDYMLNNLNVDPNLVNALFIVNPTTGEVTFNLDGTLEHQWMTDPNNGVIATTTAAVNEFIADLQNMQDAVDDMTQLMHFAEQEANPQSPANPAGGEGYPTPAEWQDIFEGLQDNLEGIKNNWGSWLNYNGY